MRIVCIGIIPKNLNGFPQLDDRGHFVALFLIDLGQLFEKRHAARAGGQIFPQERFGQPIILSADGFIRKRFKGLPGGDETPESEMQRRKQTAGFDVLGIECEQFLQRSGRPAVFAGVHVRDSFFEQRAFFTVADDASLMHTRGRFFIGFLRGTFVGSHVLTLADHWAQTGPTG